MKISKKKNTVKIVVIVKSIDGGTGTFLIDLLKIGKVFKDRKILIKTLVLERPTFRPVDKTNYEIFRDHDHYPQRYSLAIRNFIEFTEETRWVLKKVKAFKPTIVLSIDMRCSLLAMVCKLISPVSFKVLITNHINLARMIMEKSTNKLNFLLKTAVKFLYNKADAIVGVSEDCSSSLKNDFSLNKKVITIYNGLYYKSLKARTNFNKGKKIIVMVARLVEQKDQENLIRAFSILQKKMSKTELWIIGDGPTRTKLELLAKDLNLINKVIFWGWVQDIKPYLRKADVFAFSSKREGFGYVLVEAMQQGLPVISTDTPDGPREVLAEGEYGILVPEGKPNLLQKAVSRILTNKKEYLYYSNKSIERSKFFSINKMLHNYKTVILDLVK